MRALAVAFLAAILCSPACAEDRPLPQMTVQAGATIEAAPDIATLRLGIVGERKNAAEAAEENARQAQAVVAELRAAGIESRDIQTSAVTLSPTYDEDRDPNGRPRPRVLRGYTARNTLTVRVHDLTRAGALARRLIDRGANLFEGIAFEVSQREQRLEEARLAALRDAQTRARGYAEALGIRLGRILQIDPDGERDGRPMPMAMRAAPMEAAQTAIPVEPGLQAITARVSVTFELVQP